MELWMNMRILDTHQLLRFCWFFGEKSIFTHWKLQTLQKKYQKDLSDICQQPSFGSRRWKEAFQLWKNCFHLTVSKFASKTLQTGPDFGALEKKSGTNHIQLLEEANQWRWKVSHDIPWWCPQAHRVSSIPAFCRMYRQNQNMRWPRPSACLIPQQPSGNPQANSRIWWQDCDRFLGVEPLWNSVKPSDMEHCKRISHTQQHGFLACWFPTKRLQQQTRRSAPKSRFMVSFTWLCKWFAQSDDDFTMILSCWGWHLFRCEPLFWGDLILSRGTCLSIQSLVYCSSKNSRLQKSDPASICNKS